MTVPAPSGDDFAFYRELPMTRLLITFWTLFPLWVSSATAQSFAYPRPAVSNQVHRQVGSPLARLVEKKQHTVEIFVTSWCPYCRELENFLVKHQIPFTRYDVEHDAKGMTLYQEMGAGGVPITRIDRTKILRGFSIEALEEALGIGTEDAQVKIRPINVERTLDLVERK